MKYSPRLHLLAALLAGFGSALPVHAQTLRSAPPSGVAPAERNAAGVGQAERNAVDLKQGMSLAEVQRLLGKPRRTSLKDTGGSIGASSQANLRWTYVWAKPQSSDNVLNVEFIAKTPAEWYVNSWEWANY